MILGKKKFRVTRITITKDDHLGGVILDDKIERRTRVELGEDGKDDGDSISITSYDGSLDGYSLELGQLYEVALSRRPDAPVPYKRPCAMPVETAIGGKTSVSGMGATNPEMTEGMTAAAQDPAFMADREILESKAPGLLQNLTADAPEDVPETDEQLAARHQREKRLIPRSVPQQPHGGPSGGME